MEAERLYTKQPSRTIQQKRGGEGALEMVDNRPAGILQAMSERPIQRVEDDEDTLQGKFAQPIQRMEDDEDAIQGKFEQPIQRMEDDEDTMQGKFEAPVQKKNLTGMPDNLKAGIEDLSGFSMDDVRVHYGSSKPAAVQAHAYTQGTDIHIAPGQERHLPHEAWHVAQQMAGRVEPTTEIGGMPVNDNAALEHEADVMGARAMQMKTDKSYSSIRNSKQVINRTQLFPPIQRIVNLYRSHTIWMTPNFGSEYGWHNGQFLYQAPTKESRYVAKSVNDELGNGDWIAGHMINGCLAGGHGGPDNTEPITASLNHSMLDLENLANAVAATPTMEYMYKMEGNPNTQTWYRADNQSRKVTNLITSFRGTLFARTRGYVKKGRIYKNEYGEYSRYPDVIYQPGDIQQAQGEWMMNLPSGINEE